MKNRSAVGSRFLAWFTVLTISALAAGCGGGGGGQDPVLGGGGNPALAPTVMTSTPLPNAVNVLATTTVITATFSKAMDASTISATSFTLACPAGVAITGTVTYATASNMASFTLPAATPLPQRTVCTATITTAVKDTVGLALATNYTWTFTTADTTAPAVASTIGASGAVNVALNSKTSVTFTEAMDPLTINATTFTLTQGVTPVAGTVTYSGVTAVFAPTAALTANTTYTGTITTGAKDVAGNALPSSVVWSFTTGAVADTTRPRVASTINANGATNVPTNTKIGATFSEGMDPASITTTSFTVKQGVTPVAGTLAYSGLNAVFTPTATLAANTVYTNTITTVATDLAGNAFASNYVWSWTTGAGADTIAPTITSTNPAALAIGVALNAGINATFSEAMDPLTVTTANFTVQTSGPPLGAVIAGTLVYDTVTRVASFTPSSNLTANTSYTAKITGAKDIAGNSLAAGLAANPWTFTTGAVVVVQPTVNLRTAGTYGTFGGTAGMTNTGTTSIINGDIGTIATGTGSITGFHDTAGDIYTETPANIGAVNGKIYTCTNSVTGPTSAAPNAAACAVATQARLDAETAYLALAGMPPVGASPAPGANLAGVTLFPGVYAAPGGSFLIEGGNLTLDARGDANAVWVFQMAGTLTVGGPGAAAPQSIILAGGAQAKNVYWQVGTFATINAGGGGTMVGTIISQSGASFSTAGNVATVTLNGRALSLGASVTLVDTVINIP